MGKPLYTIDQLSKQFGMTQEEVCDIIADADIEPAYHFSASIYFGDDALLAVERHCGLLRREIRGVSEYEGE